jgi:hypothetical protein
MTMANEQPKPVQCAWCRKVFTVGGDMACGAKVPTHMAAGPDGAWCKTDDIVKMLEKT